ncbi:MAG: hypothetical protein IMY67_01715 [Bacteroidetes bacterium]|nr:hypothetical protein [Bacteroidota bacterium]
MTDLITFLNQYPNLCEPKVSINDLGVAHRVFFNWKDKKIIDYQHNFTPEDIANNVSRKKIELNAFEALWVLIIKELRLFNIGLSTIAKLKSYLFTIPDLNFIKDIPEEDLDQINKDLLPKEAHNILNLLGLNSKGLVDYINKLPDSNKIYFSHIGFLVNYILLSGHTPSIFIYKKPLEEELHFKLYNPQIEAILNKNSDEDYTNELINDLVQHSVINIPLRPLFELFFEDKSLLKYTKAFDLFTPGELKLLNILSSRDFKKIIIHRNNDNQITIESTSSEQVLGYKAIELNKSLGLKDYQRAEIIYRNDKNLVITNTTKYKIDLGNT